MCNRYRLKARPDELIEFFGPLHMEQAESIAAEFYPGKPVPVVRPSEGRRQLVNMTWGFPPFKGKRPINNTRTEGAASSPFWKRHMNRRCVFPLSEAVEWQHRVHPETGELRKVPHAIRFRDRSVAAVAGIYNDAASPGCCSMLTCRANRAWAEIHNADPEDPRMVCFLLDSAEIAAWLDPGQPYEAVRHLLRPVPDELDVLAAQPLIHTP